MSFRGKKTTLRLKAEGDVTLVTSQQPDIMPEILGHKEMVVPNAM